MLLDQMDSEPALNLKERGIAAQKLTVLGQKCLKSMMTYLHDGHQEGGGDKSRIPSVKMYNTTIDTILQEHSHIEMQVLDYIPGTYP